LNHVESSSLMGTPSLPSCWHKQQNFAQYIHQTTCTIPQTETEHCSVRHSQHMSHQRPRTNTITLHSIGTKPQETNKHININVPICSIYTRGAHYHISTTMISQVTQILQESALPRPHPHSFPHPHAMPHNTEKPTEKKQEKHERLRKSKKGHPKNGIARLALLKHKTQCHRNSALISATLSAGVK
jgi:hypothetical protein